MKDLSKMFYLALLYYYPLLSVVGVASTGTLSNSKLLLCEYLLSAVDLDDAILVDILENMRSIHQDANGSSGGDDKKDVQLKPIDDHGHVLPVFASLKE